MTRWIVIAAISALLFAAASTLATYFYGRFSERSRGAPSHALERKGSTALDKRAAELLSEHAGESALVMLSSNLDAFSARALSARAAGRSLDLIYYIWKQDLTGRLLMNEVLAAADRGVRVRLLLDDIGVERKDRVLLALDSHPNIEARLFNPTRAREGALQRGLEMMLRAFSITRRMHNKAWIADGRTAVVGGRNIGDEYFDAAETSNFRDIDLLAFGPLVDATEDMFDAYWNSGLALPIKALNQNDSAPLSDLRKTLQSLSQSGDARPYVEKLRERMTIIDVITDKPLHWSKSARLIFDPPEKGLAKKGENWLMRELLPLIGSAKQTLEITSPYFVPGERGTATLTELAQRGVSVSILTNSLAANDVAAVHGGYAPYRKPLLRSGVKLFELRPTIERDEFSLRGSSGASLHTKAFTVDDRIGFIGSLNFDPRSSSLNTEMGVLFETPSLITQARALFASEISPDYSYTLSLDDKGALLWKSKENGRPAVYTRDPEASLTRRAIAWIVGRLPLESQL